jgi:hypothetical protein
MEAARLRPDPFRGQDPACLPRYTVANAARHLRLPLATVRSRLAGGSEPLVWIADPDTGMLSFQNLAELHVLGASRRGRRLTLPQLCQAVASLRDRWGVSHPLSSRRMLTGGVDLFLDECERLAGLPAPVRAELRQLLLTYLGRLEWDARGQPIRLFPFTRDRIEESPRLVVIDPRVCFGEPCLAGAGVPTSIIARRLRHLRCVPVLPAADPRQPGPGRRRRCRPAAAPAAPTRVRCSDA